MRFSERQGFRAVRSVVQLGFMDDSLRSRLWNLLTLHYWQHGDSPSGLTSARGSLHSLVMSLWHNIYKEPLDTLPPSGT